MKKKWKDAIIIFSILLLMFQEQLKDIVDAFRYYDELLTVVLIVFVIWRILKNNMKIELTKYEFIMLGCLVLIVVLGFIENINSGIQTLPYILKDVISCTKVFLVYICLQYLSVDSQKILSFMNIFAQLYIIIIFIFGIINLFFDIEMNMGYRFGIRSYMFTYHNPGSLAIMLICLIAILDVNYKKNRLYILLALISLIMTLRGLAIAAVGIYIVLKLILLRKRVKLSALSYVVLFIVIAILGFNQFQTYLLEDTPRSKLLTTGIQIANDYFPLGAGFGTFGSDSSRLNYSSLYEKYGVSSYYGLSKELSIFIADNYWPMIMGQFGWIGVILYIILIYALYKDLLLKMNRKNNVGIYLIFFYILASTVATQLFSHAYGVLFILVIYVLTNIKDEKNKTTISTNY